MLGVDVVPLHPRVFRLDLWRHMIPDFIRYELVDIDGRNDFSTLAELLEKYWTACNTSCSQGFSLVYVVWQATRLPTLFPDFEKEKGLRTTKKG